MDSRHPPPWASAFELHPPADRLVQALTGLVGEHQRFMLGEQISRIDELDGRIARLDEEIDNRLGPDNEERERLDGIPGVGRQ